MTATEAEEKASITAITLGKDGQEASICLCMILTVCNGIL